MPRKHRRVHHPRTNCRCPEGAKRVDTCKKGGNKAECKGRSFGCVATVNVPGARKPLPRFVKMICDNEAGTVEQWKPAGGKRKSKKKAKDTQRNAARVSRALVLPPQTHIPFRRSDEDLPLFRALQRTAFAPPPKTRPLYEAEQTQLPYGPQQIPLFNNQKKTPAPDVQDWFDRWWRT